MNTDLAAVTKRILQSGWYPGLLRWPVTIAFAFIIFELLTGKPFPRGNLGLSLTWYLWWPLFPLLFLFVGRFWCAICPFATVSDTVQKLVGNRFHVPRFIKRHGIWISCALFITIIFSEIFLGIIFSPIATAVLMLIFATCVNVSGAFFLRRTWCRYLCPLGAMASVFSRTGALRLKASRDKCRKCDTVPCYQGGEKAPGCPMFLCARIRDIDAHCNLCGNCVKNCPHDSIEVLGRFPSKGLWSIKRPKLEESFIAIVFLGALFSINIILHRQNWASGFLGIDNFNISLTLFYLSVLAAPVLLFYAACFFASKGNHESIKINFMRFGYILIPLALANLMALTTVHDFLTNGKLALFNALPFLGLLRPTLSPGLADERTILALQFVVLAVGIMACLYAAYRIAKANYQREQVLTSLAPFVLLLVFIVPFNFYLYLSAGLHGATGEDKTGHFSGAGLAMENTTNPVYNPPRPENAPAEIRHMVMFGYNIMKDAERYAGQYTGNKLSCSNCHFNAGITKGGKYGGLTLVGVSAKYPDDEVLLKKNNICFEKCMNGNRLSMESKENQALMAFYRWISKGIPVGREIPWYGMRPLPATGYQPDIEKGDRIYARKCAACHHMDGQGSIGVPPVWGKDSYNDASKIHQIEPFAIFTFNNMPLGNPNLSPEQALDVAGYVHRQSRPKFAKGNVPKIARISEE